MSAYAILHFVILLVTVALLAMTSIQYREFTRKTGRLVFILMYNSTVVGVYRSLQLLKTAAVEKTPPNAVVKWDNAALYRQEQGQWTATGYSYLPLPVQGSVGE